MVLDIARQHGVKSVVKSKSMVTEEMELNHVLEDAGHPRRSRPTWANTSCNWPGSGRSTSSRRPCTCRPPTWASCSHEKLGEPFSAEHQP